MANHQLCFRALAFLSIILLSLKRSYSFHVSPTIQNQGLAFGRSISPFHPSRVLQIRNMRDDAAFEDDEDDTADDQPVFQQASPLLQETSRVLRRISFFSWWSQVILTTVSGIILTFARRITISGSRDSAIVGADPSFFLSGVGLLVSAVSILWTWGNGSRLSRRLTRRPVSRVQAANMLRRAVRVGVTLNMAGLLVHLLAAEEIVGTLAIRVLTSNAARQGAAMMFSAIDGLQPLDVLVVQANTNSLLSHFCSLAALLFLTQRIDKLDPPSVDDGKAR